MNKEELERYNYLFNLIRDTMNWNDNKTDLWFQTVNPLLGESTPLWMLMTGRGYKLQKFVETSLDENKEF